jgi:hypothetical protein
MSKAARGGAHGLLALPSDLQHVLAELLGLAELCARLRPVCRETRARTLRLPQVAVLQALSSRQVAALVRGLDTTRLTSLRLGLEPSLDLSFDDTYRLPVLESLWISSPGLSNLGLESLLQAAPRVTTLKLTRCHSLTGTGLKFVARLLPRLRCLWWSESSCRGLEFLPTGLTEFGARVALTDAAQNSIRAAGPALALAQVETFVVKALHSGTQLLPTIMTMPRLARLRIDALLFGSTLKIISSWAVVLFVACPVLERFEARTTYYDRHMQEFQYVKRDGRKLWIREGGRVQFHADFGPYSDYLPWLQANCKPL